MFEYQRVAIILPERLGDTIFHTPSIKLLRKMRPDIRIDIIALSQLAADVVENNPYINAIYVTPNSAELKRMASRYDVVMNIHNHGASRRCVEALGISTITAVPSPHVKHQAAHSLVFFQQLLNGEIQPGEDRYTLFPAAANHSKIDTVLRAQHYAPERDILIGCHSIANTGALHAACATNVGVIALFGPTSLEATGPNPMQDNYRIVQAETMGDISAAQVCATILAHPAIANSIIATATQ